MTIYDFGHYIPDCSVQKVEVYDLANGVCETVFTGYMDEIPDEYLYLDICSIDNVDGSVDFIGINIDTSDD